MPHWRACSPVCKGSSDGIVKPAVSSPYVFMCVWHSPPFCRLYHSLSVSVKYIIERPIKLTVLFPEDYTAVCRERVLFTSFF